MKLAIMRLLEEHGSLAYDQLAAHLGEPPDAVRAALQALRERGLVDGLPVGRLEGHLTTAVAYWRLTDIGRRQLVQLHSA